MALRTSSPAAAMSFLKSKMMTMRPLLSEEVERVSLTCGMLWNDFSTRLMISRSTVSGEAPGYGKLTTMTGSCTSGIWFTRRCLSASRPSAMSTMTIATVVTGFLMLKLERNMALFLRDDSRRFDRLCKCRDLAVLQRRTRVTQHRIAVGEPQVHRVRAGARIASAERERHFLQLAILYTPRECAVALAHHRCGGQSERCDVLSFDVPLGVEARDVRLLLLVVEGHQHFDLAGQRIRSRVHARHRAREFAIREAVNPEPHALPFGNRADIVGRHQALEAQTIRIDDLEQLLADLRGVAGGYLSLAHDALERRAHFGAP